MDRYSPTINHGRASHSEQTLNAIVDFRYLAPAKLAHEETNKRMLAEAALLRYVTGDSELIGNPPLTEIVRQRLGSIRIQLGTVFAWARVACLKSSRRPAR